jgi:GcrA cell cycle regulator
MWTEDRVDSLKRLWDDGHSASVIASTLGQGLTRNAVMGKVHRLDLPGRSTLVRTKASYHRARRRTVRKIKFRAAPRQKPPKEGKPEPTKSQLRAIIFEAMLNTAKAQAATMKGEQP